MLTRFNGWDFSIRGYFRILQYQYDSSSVLLGLLSALAMPLWNIRGRSVYHFKKSDADLPNCS